MTAEDIDTLCEEIRRGARVSGTVTSGPSVQSQKKAHEPSFAQYMYARLDKRFVNIDPVDPAPSSNGTLTGKPVRKRTAQEMDSDSDSDNEPQDMEAKAEYWKAKVGCLHGKVKATRDQRDGNTHSSGWWRIPVLAATAK